MLTIKEIRKMSREQINESWDEVKQALASAREPITKEKIEATKDREERMRLINKNLHLFQR